MQVGIANTWWRGKRSRRKRNTQINACIWQGGGGGGGMILHICSDELGHYSFRYCLFACFMSSHYVVNQEWLLINHIPVNNRTYIGIKQLSLHLTTLHLTILHLKLSPVVCRSFVAGEMCLSSTLKFSINCYGSFTKYNNRQYVWSSSWDISSGR